jgi:hypothetical protein
MKRSAALLVGTIVTATTLSGCGGGNAYCDAVKKDRTTLNTFGQKRTDAAYAKYAKAFDEVGKVAPTSIRKDWTKLADVTKGVLAAQKSVGLALEDMTDTTKVKKLTSAQLKGLNTAYEAFNATQTQRNAVVKNVKQECKIKLK